MDVDSEIIRALKRNSRQSFSSIGERLGLSEGAIRKRVSNLVNRGVIKRFTLETQDTISAVIGIKTNLTVPTRNIVEKIKNFNVTNIYETTGRFDIVCIITIESMEEANSILEAIRSTEGIIATETFSVLKRN